MDSFISCDPGVHVCWFTFFLNGTVQKTWYESAASFVNTADRALIIEIPKVYPAAKQKGDPNDLIALAFSAGIVAGKGTPYEVVLPREWKGTLDKNVMVERIKSRLTKAEIDRVKLPSAKALHHNVWDSVGIGLWKLDRLQPRRNYHK